MNLLFTKKHTMRYYTRSVIFLFAILLLAGCRKDNLTPPVDKTTTLRSMGDFVRNNYDFSLLAAALKKANLLDSLNQPGPFTFLAPDNKAFNDIGILQPEDFDKLNTDSLRFALKYHVLYGRTYISEFPLQMGSRLRTLAGANAIVSINNILFLNSTPPENRNAFVNGSMIYKDARRNVPLLNGVVHVIRKPLRYEPVTVQEMLQADTSLSLFVQAMKQFKLWDGLGGKGPYTIFVPGNKVFRKYKLTADSISRMQPEKFDESAFGVYPLKLGPKMIFSTDWAQLNSDMGDASTLVQLGRFQLKPSAYMNQWTLQDFSEISVNEVGKYAGVYGPRSVHFAGGLPIGADHTASNGVVHFIDDLLLYPQLLKK